MDVSTAAEYVDPSHRASLNTLAATSSGEAPFGRCDSGGEDSEGLGSDHSGEGSSSGSDVASIQLDMPRRSMQLTFTCGKCGGFDST